MIPSLTTKTQAQETLELGLNRSDYSQISYAHIQINSHIMKNGSTYDKEAHKLLTNITRKIKCNSNKL